MTNDEALYNTLCKARDHISKEKIIEIKEPVYIVAKKDQKRLEEALKILYGEVTP